MADEIQDPEAPTKMVVARGMVWDSERRKPGDEITAPARLVPWLRYRRKAGIDKAEAKAFEDAVAAERPDAEGGKPSNAGK